MTIGEVNMRPAKGKRYHRRPWCHGEVARTTQRPWQERRRPECPAPSKNKSAPKNQVAEMITRQAGDMSLAGEEEDLEDWLGRDASWTESLLGHGLARVASVQWQRRDADLLDGSGNGRQPQPLASLPRTRPRHRERPRRATAANPRDGTAAGCSATTLTVQPPLSLLSCHPSGVRPRQPAQEEYINLPL